MKCLQCKDEFTSERTSARYCSTNCRVKFNRTEKHSLILGLENIIYNPEKVREIKEQRNLPSDNETIEFCINWTYKKLNDPSPEVDYNRGNVQRLRELRPDFQSDSHAINYALVVAVSSLEQRAGYQSRSKLPGIGTDGQSDKMRAFLAKGGYQQPNQDSGLSDGDYSQDSEVNSEVIQYD